MEANLDYNYPEKPCSTNWQCYFKSPWKWNKWNSGREWGADEISQVTDVVLREAFILHKSQDFIVSHVPRISRIFQSMKVIWLPQLNATLMNVTMKACEKCVDILQFFSVALVHFSDQKWNFQNYFVQPPHHLVTCAHHKSSFSFFWTSCNCFGTFMQLIMYISLCNSPYPSKHLVISSSYKSLNAKWLI